jgi:hypothetical protein
MKKDSTDYLSRSSAYLFLKQLTLQKALWSFKQLTFTLRPCHSTDFSPISQIVLRNAENMILTASECKLRGRRSCKICNRILLLYIFYYWLSQMITVYIYLYSNMRCISPYHISLIHQLFIYHIYPYYNISI